MLPFKMNERWTEGKGREGGPFKIKFPPFFPYFILSFENVKYTSGPFEIVLIYHIVDLVRSDIVKTGPVEK